MHMWCMWCISCIFTINMVQIICMSYIVMNNIENVEWQIHIHDIYIYMHIHITINQLNHAPLALTLGGPALSGEGKSFIFVTWAMATDLPAMPWAKRYQEILETTDVGGFFWHVGGTSSFKDFQTCICLAGNWNINEFCHAPKASEGWEFVSCYLILAPRTNIPWTNQSYGISTRNTSSWPLWFVFNRCWWVANRCRQVPLNFVEKQWTLRNLCMKVATNGGTPMAGWFMSWRIVFGLDDSGTRGTPHFRETSI